MPCDLFQVLAFRPRDTTSTPLTGGLRSREGACPQSLSLEARLTQTWGWATKTGTGPQSVGKALINHCPVPTVSGFGGQIWTSLHPVALISSIGFPKLLESPMLALWQDPKTRACPVGSWAPPHYRASANANRPLKKTIVARAEQLLLKSSSLLCD